MAKLQKKRQKRIEKKKAKRKERQRTLVKQKRRGLAERLTASARAPILDCLVQEEIWDSGVGSVLLSRELPNGRVAFGMFLVDMYCLGAKDAMGDVVPRADYQQNILGRLDERWEMVELDPPAARKLVEGAVEYAAGLGLTAHADYHRVKAIFGDIDPAECGEHFEYGHEGKPFFVPGPNESPERCRQIMSILEHACGPNGYHYLMSMPVSNMLEDDDMLDDEEPLPGPFGSLRSG